MAVLLPLASIDSSPLNPRTRFDDEDLQRLTDSLQADGLLQPIVVTPAGNRYRIVAGERRWPAAQRLSWTEILAIVRADIDDRTLIRLALLENLAEPLLLLRRHRHRAEPQLSTASYLREPPQNLCASQGHTEKMMGRYAGRKEWDGELKGQKDDCPAGTCARLHEHQRQRPCDLG